MLITGASFLQHTISNTPTALVEQLLVFNSSCSPNSLETGFDRTNMALHSSCLYIYYCSLALRGLQQFYAGCGFKRLQERSMIAP